MADWSAVWGRSSSGCGCVGNCTMSASSGNSCCLPSVAYNCVSYDNVTTVSIADELDVPVNTVSEAVSVYAERLRRLLDGRSAIVQSIGASNYTITLKRNRRPDATITLTLSGTGYPATVAYTFGTDSTSTAASFTSMTQLILWLEDMLR